MSRCPKCWRKIPHISLGGYVCPCHVEDVSTIEPKKPSLMEHFKQVLSDEVAFKKAAQEMNKMSTSESVPCNPPQWAQDAAKELNRTFCITFSNSDPEFAREVKSSELAAIIAKHAPQPNEQACDADMFWFDDSPEYSADSIKELLDYAAYHAYGLSTVTFRRAKRLPNIVALVRGNDDLDTAVVGLFATQAEADAARTAQSTKGAKE